MSSTRILVYCSLFPSAGAPTAGTFIRERMLRVGAHLPVVIVAPQPWSPIDWVIRLFRKSFRPQGAVFEKLGQVEVHRPRVLSVPGAMKHWDGKLMARGSRTTVMRLANAFKPTVIDAHFVYPDGYAASLLARELGLPLTITLRGSKDLRLLGTDREPMLKAALDDSALVFSVSNALIADIGVRLGQPPEKMLMVRNGVDLDKFHPVDRAEARRRLNLPESAPVLISVGGLVEGKGFHRVIPVIARLKQDFPEIRYLVVGGGSSHGDMRSELEALARNEGVEENVVFCGRQLPDDLKWFYGAADVFTLATRSEGWANVFLEAMACGLPVVTTQVGGNAQVVSRPELGTLVPFWDPLIFESAIRDAFSPERWNRETILSYAASCGWDEPVTTLVDAFKKLEGTSRSEL
jgi:teichuronic acid biosynthesis glycosyltransferase TuaC